MGRGAKFPDLEGTTPRKSARLVQNERGRLTYHQNTSGPKVRKGKRQKKECRRRELDRRRRFCAKSYAPGRGETKSRRCKREKNMTRSSPLSNAPSIRSKAEMASIPLH